MEQVKTAPDKALEHALAEYDSALTAEAIAVGRLREARSRLLSAEAKLIGVAVVTEHKELLQVNKRVVANLTKKIRRDPVTGIVGGNPVD